MSVSGVYECRQAFKLAKLQESKRTGLKGKKKKEILVEATWLGSLLATTELNEAT